MATVSDILAANFQHRVRFQNLKAKEAEGAESAKKGRVGGPPGGSRGIDPLGRPARFQGLRRLPQRHGPQPRRKDNQAPGGFQGRRPPKSGDGRREAGGGFPGRGSARRGPGA